MNAALARRELSTRRAAWARQLAAVLARAGVQPNAVSIASIVAAFVAMAALVGVPYAGAEHRWFLFVVGAAAIQLRLLCNLLDGMLAVEHGLKSGTGELFNEIPDRIADVVILAGAGYSVADSTAGPILGWAAAVSALFTAYVRVLGGSLRVSQPFVGPMAKQHRMFVLTMAAMVAAVESAAGADVSSIQIGLALIVTGALVTAARRLSRIATELRSR
jgi:phosphatidylglycerophosphate synthase